MLKVLLKNVRFSYVRVFEASAMTPGDEPKYSVSIIISKDNKEAIKTIEQAIKDAVAEGEKSKWGGKVPASKLKLPLRDGDEEKPEDEAYANSFFLSAKSKLRPQVIDVKRQALNDETEFYSGCYGHVTITVYPYTHPTGGKGVSCGLGNILKTNDGEPLGGARTNAETDFSDLLEDDLVS